MNLFHNLFQTIGVTLTSIFVVITSTFTGQKPISTPSPSPAPIINQYIQATPTPSAIPKPKIIVTPKPTITPNPTPRLEEVTCTREETVAQMEKVGIPITEDRIAVNKSACELDKQREWSIKNTVPLQSSEGN